DLNDIARESGFQTKDCNGYNVLFQSGKPIYVDLGSFVEVPVGEDVLLPYEEFLRSYIYPLEIWRSAGQYLGGRVVPRAVGLLLAQEAYLRFRWPFFRGVRDSRLRGWWRRVAFVRTLRHQDLEKRKGRMRSVVMRWLRFEKKAGWFRGPARLGALRKRLHALSHDTGNSQWAGYHDDLNTGHDLRITPRFEAVIERLAGLNVTSVLELAGNQGVLSRAIAKRLSTARVICTDPDGLAIDKGYVAARDHAESIEWAILDPFSNETSPSEVIVQDRFRADAVVVLALTHHLTLTHNFRLDHIFDVIRSFAKSHVFIEFMPLGLHDGTSAPPFRDGYNEDWFDAEFRRHFEMIDRVQLEPNRILFVGRITQRSASIGSMSDEPAHQVF
ncbi:MAG: hypothetical protein ACREO3_06910, partial [Arenimonas sp.]